MEKYRWIIILLSISALPLLVIIIRFINSLRYPPQKYENSDVDLRNMDAYPTKVDSLTISKIQQNQVNGFHILPDEKKKSGIVVTLGGSEGGCDYFKGIELAQQGYEVFSLFYFGQQNQPEVLNEVPLEFFQEFYLFAQEKGFDTQTITVIGTSKGAELALLLSKYYGQIKNIILYAPSAYVFHGLNTKDYQHSTSSWTYNKQEIPYISFRNSSVNSFLTMFSAMIFNYPMSFYNQYKTAIENAKNIEEATIKSNFKGNILLFSGEKDAMIPSSTMANLIHKNNSDRAEHVCYENAGHLFLPCAYSHGISFGGSKEENEKAKIHSDMKLIEFLNKHHQNKSLHY